MNQGREIRTQEAEESGLWLELEGPTGHSGQRVPVMVRTLAANLVTLEMSPTRFRPLGDDLKGRKGRLRLAAGEGTVSLVFDGIVTSTGFVANGRPKATLGLKLTRLNQKGRRTLENLIPHTHRDLQVLWTRWDEAHRSQPLRLTSTNFFLGISVLIMAGCLVSLTGFSFSHKLGNGLIFAGSVIGIAYCLKFIRQRQAAAGQKKESGAPSGGETLPENEPGTP
ncbi:MAG: hypothetical protein WCD80_01980 [Desulfobaccales bacterium]